MPWEITIRAAHGTPLGERDVVRRHIADAFPGVQFRWEPSGPEKITAFRVAGHEFPDIIREHFERTPSKEQADFEGDEFSVRFYLGVDATLYSIDAEVRGDTKRVFPYLERLVSQSGWVVAECGCDEPFLE